MTAKSRADPLTQLSDLFQTHSTPSARPEWIIASGSAIDPAGYDASTKVRCKKRYVLSTHRVSRCTPSNMEMAERYQPWPQAHPKSQSGAKCVQAASRKAICKMPSMGRPYQNAVGRFP